MCLQVFVVASSRDIDKWHLLHSTKQASFLQQGNPDWWTLHHCVVNRKRIFQNFCAFLCMRNLHISIGCDCNKCWLIGDYNYQPDSDSLTDYRCMQHYRFVDKLALCTPHWNFIQRIKVESSHVYDGHISI